MSNLVQFNNDDFFGETITEESFRPPRVSLGQPSSQNKKAGCFNFPDGRAVDRLENLVLIKPTQSRVLYGKTFQSPALCGSDNYFNPADRFENPPQTNCKICPLSGFGDVDEKKEFADKHGLSITNFERPMCKASYDLILAEYCGDGVFKPFLISFQGASRAPLEKKLLSTIKMWDNSIPKCAVMFDMKAVNASSGKGNFYLPDFGNFRVADDVQAATNIYKTFSGIAAELFAQDNQNSDEEKEKEAKPVDEGYFSDVDNNPPSVADDDEIPF